MIETQNHNAPQRRSSRALTVALWFFITLLLALPVWLSIEHLLEPPARWAVIAGAAGLALLLLSLDGLLRRRSAWWGLIVLLLALVWLRGLYFGLVEFSGSGFTREFFVHMEWRSFVIAWEEYNRLLRKVGILLLLVLIVLGTLARFRVRPGRGASGALLLLGVIIIGLSRAGLPEAELLNAWEQWNEPVSAVVDRNKVARFEAAGLLNAELLPKDKVLARAAETPRNLILVYLESIGVNLAAQAEWPGLMPHYEALMAQHGLVDHLWASSYITIEGLTNSMCGTLFPYIRGNDSMAEGEGLAENLACLGDVLNSAGYQQVYLGGAGMSFAGKGEFLGSHGFDEVRGLEYWRSIGMNQRPDTWGLSDADLFEQSLKQLHELHAQDQPFNLTLLTIGTHLPGYRYAECEPYAPSDNRFLQALHCTDQLLQRFIEQLHEQNLLDDTLLVITADHHVFPNPEMRELFGDDVYDRRLPLIVMGQDIPESPHSAGAGYDLAPTVLDLLEIEHNAAFLLGRSLLRDQARPDYYVTRYPDVQAGQVINNGALACEETPGDTLQLPLNGCEKQNLIGTLNAMVFALSAQSSRMSCNPDILSQIAIPRAADQPVQFMFNERSESDRFIYHGRRADPYRPGLFLVALNGQGEVITRRFYPPDALTAVDMPGAFTSADPQARTFLAWRPPSAASPPVQALINEKVELALGNEAVIIMLDHAGRRIDLPQLESNDQFSSKLQLRDFYCSDVVLQ